MIDSLTKPIDLLARLLLACLFILAGMGKMTSFAETQGYMQAFGLPASLLLPTIIFQITAGVLILVGFRTRYVALLLAGFCLVTALVFHSNLGDKIQLIMFLKNFAIAGGLLLLAKHGSSTLSIDGYLERSK